MPTFLECPHCDRLYSKHSLVIHEKNCAESIHKIIEQQQQQQMKEKQKLTMKRSNSKNNRVSKKPNINREGTIERPRTRSLSRITCEENDGLRICFVCGEEYDGDVIVNHNKKCYEDWSIISDSLSTRFFLNEPKTLMTPSIDGTIDVSRENDKARQSAQMSQVARCRGCNARIALQYAHSHICVRFEPTIEFYF